MVAPDTLSPPLAHPNGTAAPPPALGPTLPPLVVRGVVVSKGDLVAILRLWIPGVHDLAMLPDDAVLLRVGGEAAEGGPR